MDPRIRIRFEKNIGSGTLNELWYPDQFEKGISCGSRQSRLPEVCHDCCRRGGGSRGCTCSRRIQRLRLTCGNTHSAGAPRASTHPGCRQSGSRESPRGLPHPDPTLLQNRERLSNIRSLQFKALTIETLLSMVTKERKDFWASI